MADNLLKKRRIGLYEKALPDTRAVADFARTIERARSIGFDYLEISVDETDWRRARLDWGRAERAELRQILWQQDFPLHSMCLSAHRKFPFGSKDSKVRERAQHIMSQAIELAYELGVRIIQLAGYDVYYEPADQMTHQLFLEGLAQACHMAEKAGVMLAIEIMDTPYLNSILKYLQVAEQVPSPFLAVYPDLGNLYAWNVNNDAASGLEKNLNAGISEIAAIHLKDSLAVRPGCDGQFRDLCIGEGEVDFVRYFEILRKLNYSGSFVIEMWHQDQELAVCQAKLQEALGRIHSAMNQANYLC